MLAAALPFILYLDSPAEERRRGGNLVTHGNQWPNEFALHLFSAQVHEDCSETREPCSYRRPQRGKIIDPHSCWQQLAI